MSKPKKTKAPDYTALANQQAALAKQNWKDQTVAMRPDQVGPEGKRDWTQDAQGNWSEAISMAPERQAIWDTLQKKTGEQLGGLDTSQADFSGAPSMPTVGGYNQQAIDTVRALQAPDLARRRAAKEAQMAATYGGMGTGAGWNTEQQNINDAESRADLQAINQSFATGRGMFADDITARNTYTGEQNKMLQNAGGMMTSAAPEDLKFGSYAQQAPVTAPNTTENAMAMWKMKQDAANAKAAAKKGGMMGGLGSVVGGIGAGFYSGWNPAAMQAGASIGGSAGGLFDS